jgi:hypothetical protein
MYDPSGQVLLPPQQRTADWVQQADRLGFEDHYLLYSHNIDEYREHVSVARLADAFYLVSQDY